MPHGRSHSQQHLASDSHWTVSLPWAAAARQVRRNRSCPGVDGASAHAKLAHALMPRLPLRLAVLGGERRSRTLLLSTAQDRLAETALAMALTNQWDEHLDPGSFAFRPGRTIIDAQLALADARHHGRCWCVDTDIQHFFDSIPHLALQHTLQRWLAAQQPVMQYVLDWMCTPVWDGAGLRRRRRGIAQGSPLSPWVANLFLHQVDHDMRAAGYPVIRYADDLIVPTTHEAGAKQAIGLLTQKLRSMGLCLHPAKTAIRSPRDTFEFLGATFRPDRLQLRLLAPPRAPSRLQFLAPLPVPALLAEWHRGSIRCTGVFDVHAPLGKTR